MEVTPRGWALGGSTVGLYVAGQLLGAVELSMLAAGELVVLVLAIVVVHAARPTVRARRVLHPARLHAGAPARAEIEVTNRGQRRTPLLSVTDGFSGRREARFAVAPVPRGESARGAFRIPTARRGVFEIGPLKVAVTDPLGLVRRPVFAGGAERITVYPHVESVAPLPPGAGRDLVGGAVREFVRSRAGDEFHSLREYVVGDDLRRVHWRTTAKTGELMIREHDLPWQARVTLLLDCRASRHEGASFEAGIEAVASVATALQAQRAIVRLLTTTGDEVPFGTGHEHHDAVMEHLAIAALSPDDRHREVVRLLLHQAAAGALVMVTGDLTADESRDLGALARRYGYGVLVRLLPERSPAPRSPALGVVDVDGPHRFAEAWNGQFLTRPRSTPGTRR